VSLKTAIIILALCCIVPVCAVQQSSPGASQAATSQANTANTAESSQLKHLTSADEAKALEADIRKMRALVAQMQSNLAFVDSTQSPLKHQFQLDIDMWNVLINQMERRAQANLR
jgi:hypothetical protein